MKKENNELDNLATITSLNLKSDNTFADIKAEFSGTDIYRLLTETLKQISDETLKSKTEPFLKKLLSDLNITIESNLVLNKKML